MLDVFELPEAGTLIARKFLSHGIGDVIGHALTVEGREGVSARDQDACQIKPLHPNCGVADDVSDTVFPHHRGANGFGVFDISRQHGKGCLAAVAFLPVLVRIGSAAQTGLDAVEAESFTIGNPRVARFQGDARKKIEIACGRCGYGCRQESQQKGKSPSH